VAKQRTQFICQQCGATSSKWAGRCDNCGAWNSFVEQVTETGGSSVVAKSSRAGKELAAQKLSTAVSEEISVPRLKTEIDDLDAVLGGGFLAGGIVLLAGQPGIGKSTLLTQITATIGAKSEVLYVSGEESIQQIKLRAERLGAASSDKLQLASSNSAEDIAASIRTGKYDLVVVDSVQTLSLAEISSAPGSVSQITNASNVIIRAAKATDTAVILVGHVTKEGSIAGPKVLEHLVDVVLNFEGDRYGGFRVVRAQKNRYGSTSEAAIFEMSDKGLKIVDNPSASLLAERQNLDGSIVMATLEGARPLLVEIQALVNPTSFGYPKRTASGFDLNRLNLLVAVLCWLLG
jgi:DNA repair protein RadA/Sms